MILPPSQRIQVPNSRSGTGIHLQWILWSAFWFAAAAPCLAQWHIASFDLKGPVKRAKLTSYHNYLPIAGNPGGFLSSKRVMEFNRRGYMLSADGPEQFELEDTKESIRAIYRDDSLLMWEENRVGGVVSRFEEYAYDSLGNRVNECQFTIEGKDTTVIQILTSYDRKGEIAGYALWDDGALLLSSASQFDRKGREISSISMGANGDCTWEFKKLDPFGNVLVDLWFDNPFRLSRIVRNFYNQAFQKVKALNFSAGCVLETEVTYRYHSNGKLARETTYQYPTIIDKVESAGDMFDVASNNGRHRAYYHCTAYDSHGLVRMIATNNVGPLQVHRWRYTYDKHGSWIKKESCQLDDCETDALREIEYD